MQLTAESLLSFFDFNVIFYFIYHSFAPNPWFIFEQNCRTRLIGTRFRQQSDEENPTESKIFHPNQMSANNIEVHKKLIDHIIRTRFLKEIADYSRYFLGHIELTDLKTRINRFKNSKNSSIYFSLEVLWWST